MRYKQLGSTGLYVSELCLGTMNFAHAPLDPASWRTSGSDSIGCVDQATVEAFISKAIEAGVNFIDTADCYLAGSSELAVGRGLSQLGVRRKDVVITSKVGAKMGPQPNNRGGSRVHILDSVRRSLERLQTDYIDLYQLHIHDSVTSLDEILRAMDDLVSQGLVHYVGVSNWHAWRVMKALGLAERNRWDPLVSVQAYYSIAGRDIERELVPLLNEERLGLLVWSPLAGGLLSGKFGPGGDPSQQGRRNTFEIPPVDEDRAWDCVRAMRTIGDARGVSVATVALSWLLSKPHVTSVIVGASRIDQLAQNLAAADFSLSEAELSALDAVSVLPAEYPGWMIELQEPMRRPKAFRPAKN